MGKLDHNTRHGCPHCNAELSTERNVARHVKDSCLEFKIKVAVKEALDQLEIKLTTALKNADRKRAMIKKETYENLHDDLTCESGEQIIMSCALYKVSGTKKIAISTWETPLPAY